jgi:hypothetical protein
MTFLRSTTFNVPIVPTKTHFHQRHFLAPSLKEKEPQEPSVLLYTSELKSGEFGKADATDLRQRSDAEAAQLE